MILKGITKNTFDNDVTIFVGSLDNYNDGDTLLFSFNTGVSSSNYSYMLEGHLNLLNNKKTIQWYCNTTYRGNIVSPSEWNATIINKALDLLRNNSGVTYRYIVLF